MKIPQQFDLGFMTAVCNKAYCRMIFCTLFVEACSSQTLNTTRPTPVRRATCLACPSQLTDITLTNSPKLLWEITPFSGHQYLLQN